MTKNNQNIGSNWQKWDLHVHTPNTKSNNQYSTTDEQDVWDLFCEKIEKSEVSVFGITDYLSVENYFAFVEKFKAKYPDSKKVFFSNVELRLEVGVNKANEEVNIHIIFSNEVPKERIEDFLSKLETNITRGGATICCNSLSTTNDFEKAGIEYKKIKPTLKKVFGNDDCYLIFAAANNQGLRADTKSPRKMNICDEIDKICDGFIGGSQNTDYYLKKDRYEKNEDGSQDLAKSCPVVSGSDSHSFDDLDNKSGKEFTKKDNKGNICDSSEITWIKAEPTFEGLKQITYEPETRISISGERPKKPINAIDSITLNIPDKAKVKEDVFCFSGSNTTYSLSPYFNCFVGGRGSGKSTILNFLGLYSNDSSSPENFWEKLSPSFDKNDKNVFSFSGTEIFEFLAQSEIENFARDKGKFTQAIYDRANGPQKTLQVFESNISKYQEELDKIIIAVADLQKLLVEKNLKEKEKRSLESTKNIIESEDYKKLTDEISQLTQKLQLHKKWSNEVDTFKTLLDEFIEFHSKVLNGNTDQIKYKESYLNAINKAKEAVKILDEKNFTKEKAEEKSHRDNLLLLEEKLKSLLNKGSFSEENIEQIKSAPQKIITLEQEIEHIKFQIETKESFVSKIDRITTDLETNKQDYEKEIIEKLKHVQGLLKDQEQSEENKAKDIKQISLEYSFNEKNAWDLLSNEFYNQFRSKYGDSERSKEVCDFVIENKETFTEDSLHKIQKLISSQVDTKKFIKFLNEVFKDERNFKIFQAIRNKHLYDVKTNKIIQVKYDNRDVEQASFGQRCTAVVVILLLFGNYPLIIDEPEAHLDSSLIANYLVPLLKKKKSDRQIIFATHNANFVINGDSEKVFILKNESGKTKIVETTIENTEYREELLKLEGGKEAFEKRGEKLNIK